MWATLAMTAALAYAPQQGDGLAVTNVRPTYGLFGAKRKDADAPKLLPGDAIYLSFDIENLKAGEDGLVQYSVGMELSRDGKVQLGEKAQSASPTTSSAAIPCRASLPPSWAPVRRPASTR